MKDWSLRTFGKCSERVRSTASRSLTYALANGSTAWRVGSKAESGWRSSLALRRWTPLSSLRSFQWNHGAENEDHGMQQLRRRGPSGAFELSHEGTGAECDLARRGNREVQEVRERRPHPAPVGRPHALRGPGGGAEALP